METKISPSEETVGIMLANGYTKKEIANHLNKSTRTVERQSEDLYRKTGSRNLANITLFMVRRYNGVDGLVNALGDITVFLFVGFVVWALFEGTDTSVLETLKTSLGNLFNK